MPHLAEPLLKECLALSKKSLGVRSAATGASPTDHRLADP